MANVEVTTVRDTVILVVPKEGQKFIALSQSEAHDMITKLCTAIEQARTWDEVQVELTPRDMCERCKRTKGPRHRCVGMKKEK